MNKFDKDELLKDLTFERDSSYDDEEFKRFADTLILVDNAVDKQDGIYISLSLKVYDDKFNRISEPFLLLNYFYNYTKESGKARCTLYFILKYLIDLNTNLINENTKISIPWIMPQTEKNINMYKKMGFSIIYDDSYRDPYVNNKPQTIKELIKNLEKWCEEENDIEHSSKKQKTNLRGSGCKRKTKKKKCINKKAKTNKNKRQRKRKS